MIHRNPKRTGTGFFVRRAPLNRIRDRFARLGADGTGGTALKRLMSSGAVLLWLAACTPTMSTGSQPGQGDAPSTQGRSALDQVADVPVPADSSVDLDRSIILGDRDNWSGRLAISSSHSANEMFDFYRQQMPRFGWTELSVVRAANSVLTFMRENRVATVQIVGARLDGARIEFIVAPRGAQSTPGAAPPAAAGAPILPR